MFNIIELLFPVIFILIFIMIIFTLAKGISTWHKNNNSPRLTVSARIVAKRQNTTYHNQPNAGDTSGAHGYHTTSSRPADGGHNPHLHPGHPQTYLYDECH